MYESRVARITRNWTDATTAGSAVTPKRAREPVIWSTPRAIARKGKEKHRRNKRKRGAERKRKQKKKREKELRRRSVGRRGQREREGTRARVRECTPGIFCGSLAESSRA